MTYKEAIDFRDKYKALVMGKPMMDKLGNNDKMYGTIQTVYIAPPKKEQDVWDKMWFNDISDEMAVLFFTNVNADFDVYIASRGNDVLWTLKLETYLVIVGLK